MATITVSGNAISSFDAGTEHVNEALVGTTYEGSYSHVVTCRYKFTTDAYGATGVSFRTANATATVRGSSSSDDSIGRMRFDITDSAAKYKTYKGNAYGQAITSYAYGSYVQGSLSIKLLPNKTYYLWIFPASNFSGMTRFSLGSCTVTTSGTYGTASSISAGSGTFGSAIPVTLSNSVSGVTHTLTVSCGGISKTLLSDSSAKSASWTPALSEYGPAIPDAASAAATFTCTTKYGGAVWGTSAKTVTVSFPASAGPEIDSVALDCDNSGGAAAGLELFVQGYSKARAAVSASGRYGAAITAYALTVGGATVSGSASVQTSAAVVQSGTVTATVKVTDSRGFTASTTRDFTVQPYARPVILSSSLYRSDAAGSPAEAGTWLRALAEGSISPLDGCNAMDLRVALKATGGDYGAETPMQSGSPIQVPGLNPDRTYTARITLTDILGNTAVATAILQTQRWAMKFGGGGTAVGFGKAPEADKVLEIPTDWQIRRGTARALFSDDAAWTEVLARLSALEQGQQ